MIVPGMPANEEDWFLPYLTDYIHRLGKHVKVRVYALKYPGTSKQYSLYGIPVTSFRKGWIGLHRRLMNAVLHAHRNASFTHVHAVWANSAGFFGAAIARNLDLPFVVTMGGEELVSLPDIQYGAMRKLRTRPLLRYAFSTADAIVAPSDVTANKLRQEWAIPPEKIHRIWFGADIDAFQPPVLPHDGPLHIIGVGGLIPVKRHKLLLKAFALVREHIPRARLTIAGDGPLRAPLERQADGLGITDAVAFPGWVPHASMPDFYRAAHIAAITSYREEIPVAMLEALACGLSVVSVNTGIAYDLAESGLFPVRIAEPAPESLAGSILAAWDKLEAQRAPLPEDALRLISVDNTVERMLAAFTAIAQA
jgi:glycosyltransferase involved in cell wall biosynthesis